MRNTNIFVLYHLGYLIKSEKFIEQLKWVVEISNQRKRSSHKVQLQILLVVLNNQLKLQLNNNQFKRSNLSNKNQYNNSQLLSQIPELL